MEELRNQILKIHDFSDEEVLTSGLSRFKLNSFRAREHLLDSGKKCTTLHFPIQSIIRCFYINENGEEHTLWMKPEGQFITEYKSFTSGEASIFSLQLYEDSEVWSISRKDLEDLYEEHGEWAVFGIRMMEQVHVTLIDVFVNLLANDATRNYQYIEYMFPRFIKVAPLKDIASMLQVSQVTLSRIRSGTQLKP